LMRCSRNRARHFTTVARVSGKRLAISPLGSPQPQPGQCAPVQPGQLEWSANAPSKQVEIVRLRSTPVPPSVVALACWYLPFR
jgi:hypothetical protein